MEIFVNLDDLVDEYRVNLRFSRLKTPYKIYRLEGSQSVFVLEDDDLLELQKRPFIVGKEFKRHITSFRKRFSSMIERIFPPKFGRRVIIPVGKAPNYLKLDLETNEGKSLAPIFYGKLVDPNEVDDMIKTLDEILSDTSVFLVYGYLSTLAVAELNRISKEEKVDFIAVSLSAIASPDSEGRAVLYGPDLGKLRSGVFEPLGGAVPREVLVNLLGSYAPGTNIVVSEVREAGECSELKDYYISLLDDLEVLLESPVLDSWQYEVTYRLAKEIFEEVDICGLSWGDRGDI